MWIKEPIVSFVSTIGVAYSPYGLNVAMGVVHTKLSKLSVQ